MRFIDVLAAGSQVMITVLTVALAKLGMSILVSPEFGPWSMPRIIAVAMLWIGATIAYIGIRMGATGSFGQWATCAVLLLAMILTLAIWQSAKSESLVHGLPSSEDEHSYNAHIQMRTSGSSFGPWNEWQMLTIRQVDNAQQAEDVTGPGNYRWYRFVSGPQLCIFTADSRDGRLVNMGGGRNCPKDGADNQCGFIWMGYHVYAAAGRSCSQYGISACDGIGCW